MFRTHDLLNTKYTPIQRLLQRNPERRHRSLPVNKVLPGGGLAAGTEEHIVSPDTFPTYGRAAPGTGLVFPIPHLHVVANLHMNRFVCFLYFPYTPIHH